ncbi:RNA 3'-terminal phosphate cyclase (ATP) [Pseudoduganella flava]|uniref:RNA 3'-terminal phosphate cyclase n=2 Tax=Pseudoduganella flava TaxID=871742 RepID=A0A562P6R9_9BURK|nr:RNA 3'-terminal phosphate cyclase [Pseudoduganella flava]QGZ43107.1 RNA 3'-terminal phosphate cyclase [Pseudoduganella flava]TWI40142.1 RNA 3'-terminal phosphate cyclase (ATP) [Pseudoduganella flava]
MIALDGSTGEGGGQILRSALTLSMITGQPFHIRNIRANRQKPGLMRQHLMAVRAAAAVCDAEISHADVGSTELAFTPRCIKGGVYEFTIGTAGSSTLVLQTLMPALLYADVPSVVKVSGGTHNPKAPPAHFIEHAYVRMLEAMGAQIDFELKRFGFYPNGGGEVCAAIWPCPQLRPLHLMAPGALRSARAESYVAALPLSIAQRELECVRKELRWRDDQVAAHPLANDEGPGNTVLIMLESEHVTEVFSAVGERRRRAEDVAGDAVLEAQRYLASGAAVGEHLGDQLMLPLAIAGGGSYTLDHVSQHAITNAEVIAQFLPVHVTFDALEQRSVCTIAPRA